MLLLCGVLPSVSSLSAAPAEASSVYLCTGYRTCSQAGMSDGGYGAVNGKMYWLMYGGHNCTNYVAYRMIQAGMANERPWSGTGMAYNWGRAMSRITDAVPAVGAVAWYEAGASGAGSSGHVAIVEQVVSNTEIIISEDSFSGDFHWRRIVKDGTSWPTGFIHFIDAAVVNKVAPRVLGTPQVGVQLRAAKGRWKPVPTYGYQWLADQQPVIGATAQTFTPGPAEVGKEMSVRVTASKGELSPGVVDSASTAPVAMGELTNTAPPVVRGDPEVDAVLTAASGSWSVEPDSRSYQWESDGARIPDASGRRLTLVRSMVGTTITAVEVARRTGFVTASAPTPQAVGPVVEGAIEMNTEISASGRNRYASELSLSPAVTTPSGVSTTYTWLRDDEVIAGAQGSTYDPVAADVGHLISARVTLAKARFGSIVRNFEFGRTTTTSTVGVRALGRAHRAVVRVRVTAPGASATGLVKVRVGSSTTSATLVNGSASLVVRRLKAGVRTATVTYAGDDVVQAGRGTSEVRIEKGGRKGGKKAAMAERMAERRAERRAERKLDRQAERRAGQLARARKSSNAWGASS